MKIKELKHFLNQYHAKKGFFGKLFNRSSAEILQLEKFYALLSHSPESELTEEHIANIQKIATQCRKDSLSELIFSAIIKEATHTTRLEALHIDMSAFRYNISQLTIAASNSLLAKNQPAIESIDTSADIKKIITATLYTSSFTPSYSPTFFQSMKDVESARSRSAPEIPRICHLIWLGSALGEQHCERVKQWKTLNPTHIIKLWIDPVRLSHNDRRQMELYATESNIELNSIVLFQTAQYETFFQWIEKLYAAGLKQDHITNYAVMSDILRYIILENFGGWYVDTDIVPIALPRAKPEFGFYINSSSTENGYNFSPSVIGSIPGSHYCQRSIELLSTLSQQFIDHLVELQSTKENHLYITATTHTTGQVGLLVCTKLLVEGIPLIELDTNDDFQIAKAVNEAIILPRHFKHLAHREKSWYAVEDAGLTNDELYKRQSMTTDNEYKVLLLPNLLVKHGMKTIAPLELEIGNKNQTPPFNTPGPK